MPGEQRGGMWRVGTSGCRFRQSIRKRLSTHAASVPPRYLYGQWERRSVLKIERCSSSAIFSLGIWPKFKASGAWLVHFSRKGPCFGASTERIVTLPRWLKKSHRAFPLERDTSLLNLSSMRRRRLRRNLRAWIAENDRGIYEKPDHSRWTPFSRWVV